VSFYATCFIIIMVSLHKHAVNYTDQPGGLTNSGSAKAADQVRSKAPCRTGREQGLAGCETGVLKGSRAGWSVPAATE